jgi:hypothetical protein
MKIAERKKRRVPVVLTARPRLFRNVKMRAAGIIPTWLEDVDVVHFAFCIVHYTAGGPRVCAALVRIAACSSGVIGSA